MLELISHPGLQFELFELCGVLTYILTRPGRPARQYVLSESDIDDFKRNEAGETSEQQPDKPGLAASAVGIRLHLLKNDGNVHMNFEGADGSAANWTFEGLTVEGGKVANASATTQTISYSTHCETCGQKYAVQGKSSTRSFQNIASNTSNTGNEPATAHKARSGLTGQSAVQSNTDIALTNATTFDTSFQSLDVHETKFPALLNSSGVALQTDVAVEPEASKSTHSSVIAGLNTGKALKRKSSSVLPADPALKRAKSRHDSPRLSYEVLGPNPLASLPKGLAPLGGGTLKRNPVARAPTGPAPQQTKPALKSSKLKLNSALTTAMDTTSEANDSELDDQNDEDYVLTDFESQEDDDHLISVKAPSPSKPKPKPEVSPAHSEEASTPTQRPTTRSSKRPEARGDIIIEGQAARVGRRNKHRCGRCVRSLISSNGDGVCREVVGAKRKTDRCTRCIRGHSCGPASLMVDQLADRLVEAVAKGDKGKREVCKLRTTIKTLMDNEATEA